QAQIIAVDMQNKISSATAGASKRVAELNKTAGFLQEILSRDNAQFSLMNETGALAAKMMAQFNQEIGTFPVVVERAIQAIIDKANTLGSIAGGSNKRDNP